MAGQLLPLGAIFSGRAWLAPDSVGDGGGRGLPFRTAATFSLRRLAEPRGEALVPRALPLAGARGAQPRLGSTRPAPCCRRRVDDTVRPTGHHPRYPPNRYHTIISLSTHTIKNNNQTSSRRPWKGKGALVNRQDPNTQEGNSDSRSTLPPAPYSHPKPSNASASTHNRVSLVPARRARLAAARAAVA